jgi:hypothetical protein
MLTKTDATRTAKRTTVATANVAKAATRTPAVQQKHHQQEPQQQ